MRNRMCLLALVLTMMTVTWAQTKKVTAPIDRVTVFTNGAQVARSATVQLSAGEQVITFTGLSPYMDVKSLQLKALGSLTVLGIGHRTTHPDSLVQVGKLREAEKALNAVERKIQQVKDEQEVIEAQKELVKTNCSVSGRTVATPLTGIKELNSYYATEMLSLKKRTQELDIQLATLEEERQKKSDSYDSLCKVKLTAMTEVDVKVNAQQAVRANFSLNYYVRNAGWYPTYDLRSNGLGQPLQLSYKANVYQKTREEWKNIPVTLSSANPNRSNVAPELKTYWLDFGLAPPRYDFGQDATTVTGRVVSSDDGDPIIGATVMVNGTRLGTVTDVNGNYSITLPQGRRQLVFTYVGYETVTSTVKGATLNVRMKEDKAALQEVVVIGYGKGKKSDRALAAAAEPVMLERRVEVAPRMEEESAVIEVESNEAQFGYEFEIKQLLTIPSNGQTQTTEIARYQLPASYIYKGIPKIDQEAFLVADATDWQRLNLLEGEANVYFENSFVGKTIVDPTTPSDTLNFSLGRDPGIRLQRTKVNESSTRKFLASNQEQTMTWRITVKNTRKEPVSLTLYDQTPISRNEKITVSIDELSGGKRDEQTGQVTWQLQLQPNEQRELILQYKVKYPKNRKLTIE